MIRSLGKDAGDIQRADYAVFSFHQLLILEKNTPLYEGLLTVYSSARLDKDERRTHQLRATQPSQSIGRCVVFYVKTFLLI